MASRFCTATKKESGRSLWRCKINFNGQSWPLYVSVDIGLAARENAAMQVTLTKDLKEFIVHKVRAGGYANPSEVVRDALRNFRAKDDPAENDSQELAELLLPAVRGKHRPLTAITSTSFDSGRGASRLAHEPGGRAIRLLLGGFAEAGGLVS